MMVSVTTAMMTTAAAAVVVQDASCASAKMIKTCNMIAIACCRSQGNNKHIENSTPNQREKIDGIF